MLSQQDFINKHKSNACDFTRTRKLPFIAVFILILRNSVKSIQLILNEFMVNLNAQETITASAFTQARKKLQHTAYQELSSGTVSRYYEDNDHQLFKGYRLIGVDGSRITLPKSKELEKTFGEIPIGNQCSKDTTYYTRATFVACYDVLNNIAIDGTIDKGDAYECETTLSILNDRSENDLFIFDRGYCSYTFMAHLINRKLNFVIRATESSTVMKNMFDLEAPNDFTVIIDVPNRHKKTVKKLGLPTSIKVRLVRVILDTGEIEVLATSILEEEQLSPDELKTIYGLRWGVETFFSTLKGRLALDNFTGKSVEAIKQDIWSTVFISNLETVMTEDIQKEINEANIAKNCAPKKINKAVSFNAIKTMAFEIFDADIDLDSKYEQLETLFRMNTNVIRPQRIRARKKPSITRSFNFQKRKRKHVF